MTEPMFLIWSIEHTAWWRPNWFGYTDRLAEAGRYGATAADEILQAANRVHVNECKVPVQCVEPSVSTAEFEARR